MNSFVIHVRPWNAELSIALRAALRAMYPQARVELVTLFREARWAIERAGLPVIDLLERIRAYEHAPPAVEAATKRLASDFDAALVARKGYGLNYLLATERFRPAGREATERFKLSHLAALSDVIGHGTRVISFTLDHFVYWLSAELACWRGGDNMSFMPFGVPQGRLACLRDPYTFHPGRPVAPAIAMDLLRQNTERLSLPMAERLTYMRQVRPPSRLRRIRSILRRRWAARTERKLGNYFFTQPKGQRFGVGAYEPTIKEATDLAGPFVYYPLHLDPEMTTIMLSAEFPNQAEVVRLLSQQLPTGYRLLVKENPKMIGRRPADYYRRLTCLPGVELVAIQLEGQRIVERAEYTVSLSGTAAFEALLSGRKSLVLGRPPHRQLLRYHSFGLNRPVGQLSRLLREDWEVEVNEAAWQRVIEATIDLEIYPRMDSDSGELEVPQHERAAQEIAHFIFNARSE